MPAKKPTTQESEPEKKSSKFTPEVIIAIVSLIGTIVTAIVAPIVIEKWKSNSAPSTAIATEALTTQIADIPKVVVKAFTPVVSLGDVVDAKGVVMVFVPAGKFKMGGVTYENEEPIHDVYLDAFYIDKYEVTNSFYKVCVDSGTCQLPKDASRYKDPKYFNHPVGYVTWSMAQAYCEWRGALLPTEAQWEKASRGTDERTYPWGEVLDTNFANYNNSVGDTTVVGSYESGKSPYGAYDMSGNVYEWVFDWYLSDYYLIIGDNSSNPSGPSAAPYDASDSSYGRVWRGGRWSTTNGNHLRSAYRAWDDPDASFSSLGFRCARPETISATATVAVTLTASVAELNLPTSIVDSKKVEMALVPAGEFTMGTDNKDANESEKPAHQVYINAFYIDKYEVTNTLYEKCVASGVCEPPVFTNSATRDSYFDNPDFTDYPVVYVDWNMALSYCEWRDARLPTEAEWEKAARGVDGRTYPWGEDVNTIYANLGLAVGDTTSVGFYEIGRSAYGVYDMVGNVWEWVADWWADGYYKASPSENPSGPVLGKFKVLRGGAYYLDTGSSKVYDRTADDPTKSYQSVGFRCAKDVTP